MGNVLSDSSVRETRDNWIYREWVDAVAPKEPRV